MMAQRRSSLAFGLVLVLFGVWFLVVQFIPGLQDWFRLEMTWPLALLKTYAASSITL